MIHQGGGVGGMFHIQVPVGAMFSQGRRIVGSARPERVPRNNSHRQGLEFDPLLTLQRWAEEMKILHGDFVVERVVKLTNHLLLSMLPAALEAQKKRAEEDAKQEAEKARKAEEELKRKADEDERKKEDESDGEEKANDAATIAQNSMLPPAVVIDDQGASSSSTANIQRLQDTVMEAIPSQPDRDSEMSDASEIEPPVPPQAPQDGPPLTQALAQSSSTATPDRPERITVMIHGSAVDITDTGIDPTFLEALPDDMREEVLNQHVRDQQASRVERPPDSQISAEFLDALPPEIRAEIIQQEAVERARRRTEESTRVPVREAAEIDAASFIASLDPSLRQAVLLDQDDNFLQTLPSHMIAEAGVYRDEVQARRSHTSRNPIRPIPIATPTKKNVPQHDAIMLLDRAGVAILIRLLFYPQVLKKTLLFKVLVNLCENMKTRTELFNLLLGILQDGTGDLIFVDKSFSQMSVRSREHKPQPSKTSKQKSTDYVPAYGGFSQMEVVPDLIAQRCLESLTYIVNANDSSSLFFLTEHDSLVGLRKPSGKKGKGKEKQVSQTFYPLVLLLNLLDRQSLLRTPAILESVVGLLATITRPLTGLKEQSKALDTVLPSSSQSPSSGNVEVNNPSISSSEQQVPEDSLTEIVPGGKTTT